MRRAGSHANYERWIGPGHLEAFEVSPEPRRVADDRAQKMPPGAVRRAAGLAVHQFAAKQ
jgi:hypothetical protein